MIIVGLVKKYLALYGISTSIETLLGCWVNAGPENRLNVIHSFSRCNKIAVLNGVITQKVTIR
jgi:hypothetical protein